MFDLKTMLLIFLPITGIVGQTTEAVTPEADKPTIVTRAEWGAKEAHEVPRNLSQKPVPFVIIRQSGTPRCDFQDGCKAEMRDIQKFDLDTRKIIDIRYNFCIGGDGNVYEARGWDAAGAHAEGWNDRSIAICMIGKFKSHPPRQTAINALKNLIAWGISLKKISPSYKMYTYNQVISSEDSEREELTDAIKALPHGGPFKYSI